MDRSLTRASRSLPLNVVPKRSYLNRLQLPGRPTRECGSWALRLSRSLACPGALRSGLSHVPANSQEALDKHYGRRQPHVAQLGRHRTSLMLRQCGVPRADRADEVDASSSSGTAHLEPPAELVFDGSQLTTYAHGTASTQGFALSLCAPLQGMLGQIWSHPASAWQAPPHLTQPDSDLAPVLDQRILLKHYEGPLAASLNSVTRPTVLLTNHLRSDCDHPAQRLQSISDAIPFFHLEPLLQSDYCATPTRDFGDGSSKRQWPTKSIVP